MPLNAHADSACWGSLGLGVLRSNQGCGGCWSEHRTWSSEALTEGFCLEVCTPPLKGIFTGGSGCLAEGGHAGHVLAGPALAHSVARARRTYLCLASQVAESVGCWGSPQSCIRAWVCRTERQPYFAQDTCVEHVSVALGVGHGEGRAQPDSKSTRELRVRNDSVDVMSPKMER